MKRLISLFMTCCFAFCIAFTFVNCAKKASDFTVEQHIQRITERIESRGSTWGCSDGESYQSFQVYPLYNKNEEVNLYLVEFEPYGFVFVRATDETPFIGGCVRLGMYMLSDFYGKTRPWTPYTKGENSPYLPCLQSLLEGLKADSVERGDVILDENGEIILYDRSPYFVTGNINEKKYILATTNSSAYICAVKREGKFINLMSGGLELPDEEKYKYEEHATIVALGYAGKQYELTMNCNFKTMRYTDFILA